MVTVGSGGSKETDTPLPTGEYAQSCLGRERMFEYGSKKFGTEVVIIRLNYAVELRYGVLVDIALKVFNNQPIDLSMGYFNVIWQGDANDFVLRSIELCHSPTKILNITGKEILSVRKVARDFGKLMGKDPIFAGDEDGTALLNDSSEAFKYFGNPKIPVLKIIKWITAWICENRRLLNKPTHYEVKNGRF
jgi:nucleoside-diphosphate-sugar epimerase